MTRGAAGRRTVTTDGTESKIGFSLRLPIRGTRVIRGPAPRPGRGHSAATPRILRAPAPQPRQKRSGAALRSARGLRRTVAAHSSVRKRSGVALRSTTGVTDAHDPSHFTIRYPMCGQEDVL